MLEAIKNQQPLIDPLKKVLGLLAKIKAKQKKVNKGIFLADSIPFFIESDWVKG